MENKIPILCTRPLSSLLLDEAAAAGIAIDEISFIETESILSVEVQQEIELASTEIAIVVFTSMNAVDAVTIFLDGHQPEWSIYSIGTATARLVAAYFGEEKITGTANDASAEPRRKFRPTKICRPPPDSARGSGNSKIP